MLKIRITQVCAYANWPTESFEVWKWCESHKPKKEIAKIMRSLFLTIFSRVVLDKGLEELEHASRTVGITDEEIDVPVRTASKILQTARFARYLGECLDKKRLQYFAPSKVISQGIIIVRRNGLVIQPEIPKPRQLSCEEKRILFIREILGDDSMRVKSDMLRASLGQEWNYLFAWKEGFDVKTKRRRLRG